MSTAGESSAEEPATAIDRVRSPDYTDTQRESCVGEGHKKSHRNKRRNKVLSDGFDECAELQSPDGSPQVDSGAGNVFRVIRDQIRMLHDRLDAIEDRFDGVEVDRWRGLAGRVADLECTTQVPRFDARVTRQGVELDRLRRVLQSLEETGSTGTSSTAQDLAFLRSQHRVMDKRLRRLRDQFDFMAGGDPKAHERVDVLAQATADCLTSMLHELVACMTQAVGPKYSQEAFNKIANQIDEIAKQSNSEGTRTAPDAPLDRTAPGTSQVGARRSKRVRSDH